CALSGCGSDSRIKSAKNQQAETAVAANNASNAVAAAAHNKVHGASQKGNGAQSSGQTTPSADKPQNKVDVMGLDEVGSDVVDNDSKPKLLNSIEPSSKNEPELSESLDNQLRDEQFRETVITALGLSKKEAIRLPTQGSVGLSVKLDENGDFSTGEFPNNIPNKNITLGVEEGGRGALGDLREIKDAKAAVIGVSRFSRNHTVLADAKKYQSLSTKLNAPVFVGGVKTNIFIFEGNREPVKYDYRSYQ
ncbi:hypothetical protein, partial [Alteromonas sp. a30]|uniref:hypothetical protein n=1 Tax=Alteromonas sp. a30 TaxID=2730917 RepID=UPI00227FA4D8